MKIIAYIVLLSLTIATWFIAADKENPQTLPQVDLPNLYNQEAINLNKPQEPYILVTFASWCTSCLAEHPLLMKLTKRNVNMLGLGWKDTPENLKVWLNKHGNPFKQVAIDENGDLTKFLKISGTPETFVIHQGKVIYKHVGMLDTNIINYQIIPLLNLRN